MNILVISGILPLPGTERANDFLIELYTAYKKKYTRDEIRFIRPTTSKAWRKWKKVNGNTDEFQIKDFNIKIFSYFSVWRFPIIHTYFASCTANIFNHKKIGKFIQNFKPDIIQAQYIVPDGFLAYSLYRRYNIPYLITTHNEYRYFDYAYSRKPILKMLQNACFVTPLNYVSKETMEKYAINRCKIIPLGVDERFLNVERVRHNSKSIKVLSVGVLYSLKNFDKVLYALANMKANYEFIYTIAGNGPEKENLIYLTEKLGLIDKVVLLGSVDYQDIPKIMADNDIFIMPSYFETFGRVYFEAMATGLPIICAKYSGVFGYFKEGVEGFSVDHQNIGEIQEKLTLLFENENLRYEMGRKAKELVKKYTWDEIVTEFNNLYNISLHY